MDYTAIRKMNVSDSIVSQKQNIGQVERIASAVIGSWLLFSALGKQRSIIGRGTKLSLAGYMLYRGVSGNCPMYTALGIGGQDAKAIELRTSLTVSKPKEEVFRFWRKLENLPSFMEHLKTVNEVDNRRSHWEAKIPGNIGTIGWDAEITEEIPGELIAWQSVDNATIYNAGTVSFRDSPDGGGTEVLVKIIYQPPAGNAGTAAAKLLNPLFEKMVKADIMRFKQFMETGELARVPQ